MISRTSHLVERLGGASFLCGLLISISLVTLVPLSSLRGPQVIVYLTVFSIASAAYALAVFRLGRDRLPLTAIWIMAIIFRLILLLTESSLSDDVYRFIWDGHLLRQGINPYAQPVNSPVLDSYNIPTRDLVNHDWMASPYLPAAQLLFYSIPGQLFAFRIAAVLLDLAIGWLVFDSLRRLSILTTGVLIYLWNPLVMTEFANGVHIVDAWMIFLVMLAFWLMLHTRDTRHENRFYKIGTILSMAAATLTKALPALLVPIFFRRWRWKHLFLYLVIVGLAVLGFASNAGWGIMGLLDGKGVFGALRIYTSLWNFNSSFYHWLEVLLSSFQVPGMAGSTPVVVTRVLTSAAILLASLLTGVWAWRLDSPMRGSYLTRTLSLLRMATIPIAAYLLFSHTVHPWYVIFIIPLLPFLLPASEEQSQVKRFIWPWMYFSMAVSLSYFTYIDPEDLREYSFVRQLEYLPLFALLIWAAWPWVAQRIVVIFDKETIHERRKQRG